MNIEKVLERNGCVNYSIHNGLVYFHHQDVFISPTRAATMAIKEKDFTEERLKEQLRYNRELYRPMREAMACQS